MDDGGRFVAWADGSDIRFANGFVRGRLLADRLHGSYGIDSSGQYYFLEVEAGRTIVAAIERPGETLVESPTRGEKLFYQGGKLYLYGHAITPPSYGREIHLDIFERAANRWTRTRAVRIARGRDAPSPFYVADMEPWSERVLVVDSRDLPFASRVYLYDVATGTRTRVHGDEARYMLFLKQDLIAGLGRTVLANNLW